MKNLKPVTRVGGRAGVRNPVLAAACTIRLEPLEQRRLLCVDHTGQMGMMPPETPPDAIPVEPGLFAGPGAEVTRSILIIRATWADAPTSDPQSAASVMSMMDSVNQFIQQNSYGAVNFTTTVTDLIVLPGTQQSYIDLGIEAVLGDARAKAAAENPAWNFTNFDLEAVRYNGGPGNFGGAAYVGARGCWLKSSSAGVAAHEFGHNLGLWHANSWDPTADETIVGPGANVEYGDSFDTMGSANAGAYHYNTYEKNLLGWLPGANVSTVAVDSTVRLYAHDLGVLGSQKTYAIKVRRDADRDYWLEFRQHSGFSSNPWLMNGIGIRWDRWAQSNSGSHLLDTTPFTPDGKSDAGVVLGRTWTDPVSRINITPVARITGAEPAMDVRVTFGRSANAPAGSLSAPSTTVAVGQTLNFSVAATDADGDQLAYHWDFGDKTFGLNQNTAGKSWNTAGRYRVRVTVSDMRGNTWSDSVVVTVGSPPSNRYQVDGVVLDRRGEPVANILVTNGLANTAANYRYTYTDSDGSYTLTNVPSGTYTMTALRAAAAQSTAGFVNPLSVTSNKSEINFQSNPQQFKITGRVTDIAGFGVPGAMVSNGFITEPTDLNGNYTLPNAELGQYVITASKPGYDLYRSPLQPAIVNFTDATNIIVREQGFDLIGQVVGVPAGKLVDVTTGNSKLTYLAQGGTLYFTLPVPAGRAYLRAATDDATFTANFANPLDVTASASGLVLTYGPETTFAVSGRATDLGVGVAGAMVTLNPGGQTVVTDARGGYYIDGLAPGSYSVSVAKDGVSFAEPVRSIEIQDASLVDQNFVSTSVNAAPTFVTPAFANPNPTRNFNIAIGALGGDDQGEGTLRYDWSVVAAPPGASVTFETDNFNSASNTRAEFSAVGDYTLRVTLRDLFGATASSDVLVRIDRTPPTLAGPAAFDFQTGQRVSIPFSENVGASLSPADFVLQNLTTGQAVPQSMFDVGFDANTNIAVVFAVGNALADADYRLTLSPAGVTDLAGNPLGAGTSLDFFILGGDANRDRTVGIADFAALAANFNGPGTFGQGDFNYNGQVEIGDFSILASRFNSSLASARTTLVTSRPDSPFASTRIIDDVLPV